MRVGSTGPGQGALIGGLFLLILALLRGNGDGWGSPAIVAELAGAAALLAAFVVVERLVKEPMLPLGLFRIKEFSGAQIAAFSISASFFALFFYTTLYLQQILHLSAVKAGLVYLPATVLIFLVSGASCELLEKVSGRCADRRRAHPGRQRGSVSGCSPRRNPRRGRW